MTNVRIGHPFTSIRMEFVSPAGKSMAVDVKLMIRANDDGIISSSGYRCRGVVRELYADNLNELCHKYWTDWARVQFIHMIAVVVTGEASPGVRVYPFTRAVVNDIVYTRQAHISDSKIDWPDSSFSCAADGGWAVASTPGSESVTVIPWTMENWDRVRSLVTDDIRQHLMNSKFFAPERP